MSRKNSARIYRTIVAMGKHTTICIIDDEITLREVVRRYLELDGFQVIEAESGPQGLQALREKTVALILLDIMLPGLDGFTFMRVLKHSGEYTVLDVHGAVPVIILTSRGDEPVKITLPEQSSIPKNGSVFYRSASPPLTQTAAVTIGIR